MNPFSDFLKKAKDIFNLVSGRSERELKRLKQETEETYRQVEKLARQADDLMALNEFRTRKAAEYFLTRAAMEPSNAPFYRRLADLAATVDLKKMRGDINAYQPGEEKNREWHIEKERHKDGINKYALSHIDQFIEADPQRWARLQQNSPHITNGLKPPKP
jgi:hypothetical protein